MWQEVLIRTILKIFSLTGNALHTTLVISFSLWTVQNTRRESLFFNDYFLLLEIILRLGCLVEPIARETTDFALLFTVVVLI